MGKTLAEKRAAAAEASRRWRAKHPDRAREVGRNAYHRQQAKDGKASQPRVVLTPEERAERKKASARARTARWVAKNTERVRDYRKARYDANREELAARSAKWQRENKERARATYLKRTYGLTPEQYDALGTACHICGATEGSRRMNGDGKRYRLFVDHDHDTGKVRGLLCFKCNIAIGYFNHETALLKQAMAYLERTA